MVSFYEKLKDPSVSKAQAQQAAVFVPNGRRTQFNSSLIESWGSDPAETQAQNGSGAKRIDKIVNLARTQLKRRCI